MFADNKLFWMSFREALLMMVNAIELGLRSANALDGMTTSEIRAAWKKSQKQNIIMDTPKESALVE